MLHNNKKEEERQAQHEKICELADKYFNAAIARGEPFTEGLSDWSINKATQEIGGINEKR